MKDYKTVSSETVCEFSEKKSRFISFIAPVSTEAQVTDFLSELSKKHREASHIVYAYRLFENSAARFSDAGEPQGTGGKPTLDVILRQELFDVIIATVRYFGGTLLGTGGLTRAYSKAAVDAATAANCITKTYGDSVFLSVPYPLYKKAAALLSESGAVVLESSFETQVALKIFSPEADTDSLIKKLTDLSSASIKSEKCDKFYFDI